MNTSNTLPIAPVVIKTSKITALIISACTVTFCLFVLMSKLVENNNSFQPKETPSFTVTISDVREDTDAGEIVKTLPKPPEIKPMPKPTPTPSEDIVDDTFAGPDDWSFNIETGGGTPMFSNGPRDSTAVPIVRVPPNYPTKAASQGLEGWVSMRFSINELGKVFDVTVIESEPKRIFDREAKKALRKWKYKPQMVDGKAVVQTNQSVMLEFNLDNT